MDPEPHRHIAIFKTPRFVMAPMKTLAECARIRNVQRAAMATAAAPTSDAQPRKIKASNVLADPYNGFLLTNARFALTVEEVRAATRPVVATTPQLDLDVDFLPNEDVVLRPKSSADERTTETFLTEIKLALVKAIASHGLGTLQLCRVDGSLNVLRRESDGASSGGWSQVAAKAASSSSRAPTVAPVGAKSSFTVLSSSMSRRKKEGAEGGGVSEPAKEKKQVRKQESVVDDWERAEIEEEEREKEAAAASGGGSPGGIGDERGAAKGIDSGGDEVGLSTASQTEQEDAVPADTGLQPDHGDGAAAAGSLPGVAVAQHQQQQDLESAPA